MEKIFLISIVMLLTISCQTVEIKEKECGIHFKRFDGGIDTSMVLKPGNYKIPNWNYVILYSTEEQHGQIDSFKLLGEKVRLNYTFNFIEEETPKYHYYIGGDPKDKVESLINIEMENLRKGFIDELANYEEVDIVERLMKESKRKLAKKYIELVELKIVG